MIADATARDSRTNGFWGHTGRLVVSRRLETGELMTVTLPDDWQDVGEGGGGGGGGTMTWRGTWSSAATYVVNDGVTYNGSSYVAHTAVGPSATPPPSDSAHWALMAQAGAQGPQGVQGPQGIQGVQGDTGATGATGSQGPQGNTGAQGIQGIQGIQGNPGTAGTPGEKWFTGSGAPAGATGIVGDWYVDSTNGDYYEKTGASAWTLRGNLKGPQGIQGTQGIQGVQGNPGTTGTPGEKWFTGSGAPAGGTGIVGDWYLDSANGDYYEKTGASAWTLRGNLKGPQGIQGIQGIQGPSGTADIAPWSVAGGHLTVTPDATYDIGTSAATRPRNVYLTSFLQQATIAKPANPAAGSMRLYPKADGKFYALDSAGTESSLMVITQAQWDALLARVTALEARPVIDAVEDLKYGN